MRGHFIHRFMMLAAATAPGWCMGNAGAAVVSVSMAGTVESALFGAQASFSVGTRVSFFVSYEADPQINPDLNPLGSSGFFAFMRWGIRRSWRDIQRTV